MVKEDFSACPSCDFPALHSEFMKYLETEVACPMCSATVSRNDVKKIFDLDKYIKSADENA